MFSFILENVPCVLEMNVYSSAVQCSINIDQAKVFNSVV